jgi:hypothetical protein
LRRVGCAGPAALGSLLLLAWLLASRGGSHIGSGSGCAKPPAAWLLDASLLYGGVQAAAGALCMWLLSGAALRWLLLWEAWLALVLGGCWMHSRLVQRPGALLLLSYGAPCAVALLPLRVWSWRGAAGCGALLALALWCCGSAPAVPQGRGGGVGGSLVAMACKQKQ